MCYTLLQIGFKEFVMKRIDFRSVMFETKVDAQAYLGHMLHLRELSSSSYLGFSYYFNNKTYDTVVFRIVRRSSKGKGSPLFWFILVEPDMSYRHPDTHYMTEDECDRLLEIAS
ncbi:hypothetical protein [Tortoise microvirus 83]|nr:hypothetical protein [Tortoise microvirus 83]